MKRSRVVGLVLLFLGIGLLLVARALLPFNDGQLMPQMAGQYLHGIATTAALLIGFVLVLIGAKRAVS